MQNQDFQSQYSQELEDHLEELNLGVNINLDEKIHQIQALFECMQPYNLPPHKFVTPDMVRLMKQIRGRLVTLMLEQKIGEADQPAPHYLSHMPGR